MGEKVSLFDVIRKLFQADAQIPRYWRNIDMEKFSWVCGVGAYIPSTKSFQAQEMDALYAGVAWSVKQLHSMPGS